MSSSTHPRRRPARVDDLSSALIDSFQGMSLRKGDTFHPTAKNVLWDPLHQCTFAPARSTTCPKSLEDLLEGPGARRTEELFARVDKAIATQSRLALGAALSEPEELPVPRLMLDRPTLEAHAQRHSHSSDSGLGSSVAGSDEELAKATDIDSPVMLSTDHTSVSTEERGLSDYACRQIQDNIIDPILQEKALKEFHGLIKSVPRRIGDKAIRNLRDLEKTLIFLAPDYSRGSPTKYLRFCERTIRVLHTTVTKLHETDQKAPADRPYTQGYFFDLVEQIRRYATILAAERERAEQVSKNDKPEAMDYTSDETVSLHGGMTHNGKPAELVRRTADGKTISLATGEVVSPEDVASSSSMKRPLTDDDDDVLRSMARRKKGAKPEIHECSLCDKEFKRPCDLTKHVKTHERPWKCSDETCKYHEHGWPTEKERDRHENDKHSAAPSLYHCLYKPCPYTSKRESNCKQHMEKAHGWEYVRSKSNGKGGNSLVATRIPRGSVSQSPASAMLTPLTPIAPSPQSWSSSRRESMAPPPGVAGPSNYSASSYGGSNYGGASNYGTPAFTHPSPDFSEHFNMRNFNFNDMSTGILITPAMSDDYLTGTSGSSSHSGMHLDGSADVSPHDMIFDTFDFGSFAFQQPTPNTNASSSMPRNQADYGFGTANSALHVSPRAQLDQTFTTDNNNLYDDVTMTFDAPNGDFTLFGAPPTPAGPTNAGAEMFPPLSSDSTWGNFGGHFDANAPKLQSGNSLLRELFPDLEN